MTGEVLAAEIQAHDFALNVCSPTAAVCVQHQTVAENN
jgi:hypothetical protein